MAPPRRIVLGTTYLLTRRCYQRTFRLRPSEETNQAFAYCIALAAAQTGVEIHAICVMSNHHHIVLTDVEGRVPDFARELHRLTAKVMNARQGQWENLWSAEPCHLLELGDNDDVIRKIAYLAANPVDAGLVESPEDWPGLLRLPNAAAAASETVGRPTTYFSEKGTCPAIVTLTTVPPRIEGLGARLASAIAAQVAAAREKVRRTGWDFLGAAKVMSTSFVKRARSFEVRRRLVPRVAARNMFLRQRMVAAHTGFRRAYHEAIECWRDGRRGVEFPHGTWWMRVFHGAACVGGPAAAPS